MVNGIDILISVSDFPSLVYRNASDFCIIKMKNQKEIKESIPFTIATKGIKYIVINISKEMK